MVDFRMAYDKSGMGSRPARDWNNNTLFFPILLGWQLGQEKKENEV
tara:strand:- start:1108 stop:1245 length:138 start_codon:yes stop_codon:yes gene_type:complete